MDLNDLQQKINNYITVVSSWVRNVGKMYFSSTAEDVTVQMIDDNGNVVDTTLPNVAQFRKRVWDDVGGALGQFYRVFYVDEDIGDDNNDGLSPDNPFATIRKAISSIPYGGTARVKLFYGKKYDLSKYSDGTSNTLGVLYGKNIIFEAYGDVELDKPIITSTTFINDDFPDYTMVHRIYTDRASTLEFNNIVFLQPDMIDDKPFNPYLFNGTMLQSNGLYFFFNKCKFDNNGIEADLLQITGYVSNPSVILVLDESNVGDNSFLINNRGYSPLSLYVTSTTLDTTRLVRNIMRDADSGNPVNIISNINFSS